MIVNGEWFGRASTAFGLCVALTIASATAPHAANALSAPLEAKLHYCTTCHGISAQGFRGYYPIPRLAGQQVDYLLNQLQAFAEHRRTNNIMFNIAHDLSADEAKSLAQTFHDFNPKPLGGSASRELVSAGKKIFEEGLPAANVPPCASCHGPEAKGDGQFPRLAGQLNDYIMNKLKNWPHERGQIQSDSDPQAIMDPIAHELTETQIKAVAAYVSTLQ